MWVVSGEGGGNECSFSVCVYTRINMPQRQSESLLVVCFWDTWQKPRGQSWGRVVSVGSYRAGWCLWVVTGEGDVCG